MALITVSRIFTLIEIAVVLNIFTCQIHVTALPLIPPAAAAASESFDFQFLLNPEDVQRALTDLNVRADLVQNRLATLETQLKSTEDKWNSVDEVEWKALQGPLHLEPESDYAAVLAKFSKLKIERDEIGQLKEKINSLNQLAQTIRSLQEIINTGTEKYLHFSDVHPLMKSMLVTSRKSFDNMEDRAQFGSFCIGIKKTRKLTTATKLDFEMNHICSSIVSASEY